MKFSLRDTFALQQLPTIPRVAEELLNQLKQPEIDFKQFINTIQFDPGLACALIHTANETSDKNREISSIEKAILQIGPKRSLNVLEGINLSVQTQKSAWLPIFQFGWANSVSHAIAADALKEHGCEKDDSTLFLIGLLSDIGTLILMSTYPDIYLEKVWPRLCCGQTPEDVENSIFQFSHITVGHEFARRWRLGEVFSSSILQHHSETNGNIYTFIAQSARRTIDIIDQRGGPEVKEKLENQLSDCLGMTTDDVEKMIDEVSVRRQAALKALHLPMPNTHLLAEALR